MNDLHRRYLLFLIGCMGTRFGFVYIAKNTNTEYLPVLGYLALLPAFGFTYIFFTNSRQTGPEVFGDKIWWNNLRPIHAVLYGLFARYAIQKNNNSWMFLLFDVIIGLVSFISHHFLLI